MRGGQRRNHGKMRDNRTERQHRLDAFARSKNDVCRTEPDPVASQLANRFSRLRYVRLAAAIRPKPGAMHARDAAVEVGDAGNERRQGRGLDAALGAVIAVGQEAEAGSSRSPMIPRLRR